MNTKEFLTIMEFAEKLRIHPNTVRKAIKNGRIQAFRTGIGEKSSYRIPNTEVNRICELDMNKLISKIVYDAVEEKMNSMEKSI